MRKNLYLWRQQMVYFGIIDARNNEARMKIEAMLWIVVLILVALSFVFPKTRSFSLSAIGVAIAIAAHRDDWTTIAEGLDKDF